MAAQGRAISPVAEQAAMQCLVKACNGLLDSLPTSLQDDEKILATLPPESSTRLAMQWRAGYKR